MQNNCWGAKWDVRGEGGHANGHWDRDAGVGNRWDATGSWRLLGRNIRMPVEIIAGIRFRMNERAHRPVSGSRTTCRSLTGCQ